MSRIAIIGCGVVGAAIAYELSRVSTLEITVFDQHAPAQASTGAALGVLMGIISQKVKGNAWDLRQRSLLRYESLIPELEAKTSRTIPVNRQGIVLLRFQGDDLQTWEQLAAIRQSQGWQLDLWSLSELTSRCPHIAHPEILGAVYSPSDRQIDPTALTLALVEAAHSNGVVFRFDTQVQELEPPSDSSHLHRLTTSSGDLEIDWVVISAGLGTTPLTQHVAPVEIRPVLGQAMRIKLVEPLGDRAFQPVITGEDIHLVPLGDGEYWVGATVEFPVDGAVITTELTSNRDRLESLWQEAIAFCPALSTAKILHTWTGLRPRPHQQPAPIIAPLAGYENVLLATGHYRNGVLLAPATAQTVLSIILEKG